MPCIRLRQFGMNKGTLTSIAVIAVIFSAIETGATDRIYEVTIMNRANSGLTSVVWATHGSQARFFKRGKKASVGVAELAKDGTTSIAKRELKAQKEGRRGVHSVGEAFGMGAKKSTSFRVKADELRPFLSWATMAVCSNDTFAGQDRLRLPSQVGQTISRVVVALDAGAEVNTESRDDVPCLGAHGVGVVEDLPIRRSDAVRGDVDIPRKRGWPRYIAKIKVTRIE